jgi:phenylacetate-CoA ligase
MAIEDLLHPLADLYLTSPEWLKASAGRAYTWIPERLRLGAAYRAFREELVSTRGSAAAARLSRAKLQATLKWALETVPAYQRYRGLLARSSDPAQLLARMPITDKADIKRNAGLYVSRALPESQRLKCVTGGTSQNPLEFCLHKHQTRAKEEAYIQEFRDRPALNAGPAAGAGGITLALRGRAVPAASRPGGRLWSYEPIRAQLMLSPTHLDERHMPRIAEALAQFRPAYVEAFPSMLLPLARWLENNALPEFTAGVKGVMLYSESVPDEYLALFRRVFACPVLKHYGHSERVLMAASMPDDDRYFFWPQYGWFELVDFEDRPITRPGVLGHIVGTSFDNRVMPFVRYRTGDLGVLGASAHPELAGYPVCERIDGRVQEFLVDGQGRLVSMSTLCATHFPWFSHVESLQYEQSRAGELVLKFVAGDHFPPAMQQRMGEAVAASTGCKVRLARVARIERTARGKHRMLVQKLDVARLLDAASMH